MEPPSQPPIPIIRKISVFETLAGQLTDVHHISGKRCFSNVPSANLHLEGVVKVFRVSAADNDQLQQVDNLFGAVNSRRLSTGSAAYTHTNIAPHNVVYVEFIVNNVPRVSKALFTPLYSRGNVLEHVRAYPTQDGIPLLIDIAKALRHLHAHHVVHGAIHPSNLFIGDDGHVVITDVGIHTLMYQFIFLPLLGCLPRSSGVIYQSSEQILLEIDAFIQPTTSMDVYSFAVTAWAIFAGKEPFSDVHNLRSIEHVTVEIHRHGHQRLAKPDKMTAGLWGLLQRCLAPDALPRPRPTMEEIVAELILIHNRRRLLM